MDCDFYGLSPFYCVTCSITRELSGEEGIKELGQFGRGLGNHHPRLKFWAESGNKTPSLTARQRLVEE